MTHKRRHEFTIKTKNRNRSNSIEDADCDVNISHTNKTQHPNHFGNLGTPIDNESDFYDDPYYYEDIDTTYPEDNDTHLYDGNGDCYRYDAVMPSSKTTDHDSYPVPMKTQHFLSSETSAEAIPRSEIKMLKISCSASWEEGKERAKGTGRIIVLEQPPWRTYLPPRRPEHDYGVTQEGISLHGRLSPWLYLCDHTCDLGLCDIAFRLPYACPLGSACRWKHEILWDELSFLITSGRLNLRRARTMLANWKSSATPSEDVGIWYRMNAIIDRLQYLVEPAEIRYTYPYLFPVRDSQALFERLSDG